MAEGAVTLSDHFFKLSTFVASLRQFVRKSNFTAWLSPRFRQWIFKIFCMKNCSLSFNFHKVSEFKILKAWSDLKKVEIIFFFFLFSSRIFTSSIFFYSHLASLHSFKRNLQARSKWKGFAKVTSMPERRNDCVWKNLPSKLLLLISIHCLKVR